MSLRTLIRLEKALLLILVTVVALGFWRGIRDSFDLFKATVLWVGAPLLFVVHVAIEVSVRRHGWRRTDGVLAATAVLLISSTWLADRPWYSIIGQPHRYTGLLTLMCCLMVVRVMTVREDLTRSVSFCLALLAVPTSLYVLIQSAGMDPYEWSITSFGEPIFSTVGNPNTASGFISCLLPFVLYESAVSGVRLLRILWIGSAALVAGSVGLLLSFQGQVVVVLIAGCLVLRTVGRIGTQQAEFVGRSLLSLGLACLLGLGAFVVSTTTHALILCVGCLLIGVLREVAPEVGSRQLLTLPRQAILRAQVGVIAIFGLVAAFPLRSLIRRQLSDSLVERGDFYRAAWRLFMDRPLTGSGLENFGFYFTQYRAAGHAVRLEESRTSSVHSVPLAMFTSGGIVIGVLFVVVCLIVLLVAIRSLKFRSGDVGAYWWSVAWMVILVQSLVSVEHVALYLLMAVAGGGLLSISRTEVSTNGVSSRVKVSALSGCVLVIGVVLCMLSLVLTTRPLRSNALALESSKSLYVRSEIRKGVEQLERASELAPWDFEILRELGALRSATGDLVSASDLMLSAAEISNFNGPLSQDAAVALAAAGRLDESRNVLLRAVQNDPLAPNLRAQSTDLIVQMARALRESGMVDEAGDFAFSAASISGDSEIISQIVSEFSIQYP